VDLEEVKEAPHFLQIKEFCDEEGPDGIAGFGGGLLVMAYGFARE
jgi:hypothetical protein